MCVSLFLVRIKHTSHYLDNEINSKNAVSREIKMVTTAEALHAFIDANGSEYPFSELSTSRRGFRCRWVLLKAPCDHNVIRIPRMERFHTVPSHCFHDTALQEMTLTRQALPFPDDMADVLDVMERWGRSKCLRLYDCCARYMAWRVQAGMWIDKKCLCFALIKLRVKDIMLMGSDIPEQTFYQWVCLFNYWCTCDTHDYFELALRSIHFVQSMSLSVPAPTTVPSSPTTSVISNSSY